MFTLKPNETLDLYEVFCKTTTQVATFYKDIYSFNHQLTTVNCYLWVNAPLNAITVEETHTKGG